MPKQPSRPGIPLPPGDDEPGKHRTCGVGRAALARTEQLNQLLRDHIESDDDRLGELSRDVEQVTKKVDGMSDRFGDLRVDVAKMSSVVSGISVMLAEQNEIKHVRVIAEVETGKVEKIAAIEDEADRKKARRAFWLKVAVVVVGVLGAAFGILIEHLR